ncbi:HNH endonuclease signature motif containing protein [Arthrobacter tecti]
MENGSELTLEDAYAQASLHWSEVPLSDFFFPDGDDEFDEHARAAVENASPYGLVNRLERVTRSDSLQADSLDDALNQLRAADRLASWAAAKQAALIAQVFHGIQAHQACHTEEARAQFAFTLAEQEIAPLLRLPARTAHRMLNEALRLSESLPATWEALEAGKLSPAQAQVIVEESGSIPDEAVGVFEATVLTTAGALTRPKLARSCRRLREELHPESISVRRVRAVKDRAVSVQPEQDGMAWLGAYLPAEQAHGIFNRVDAAARSLQGPDEARTLTQLRADVFADVLTHTCTGDPKNGTGYRGVGAHIYVTVPVMTLLGHRRQDWQNTPAGADGSSHAKEPAQESARNGNGHGGGAPDLEGCESGLLDGYGPLDPETARQLAAHAPSFTRILVHPETGAVLSVGRDRYRPPKHLQDWVRITHPTCVHPGCNRSAWTSEIDHTIPWAHGGKTELGNTLPRCRLHHALKSKGIWGGIRVDPSGSISITSLAGKTYTTLPEPPPPF